MELAYNLYESDSMKHLLVKAGLISPAYSGTVLVVHFTASCTAVNT